MKDFNIAKYLKENHLGSHAILGAYVDLHGLKEEEEMQSDNNSEIITLSYNDYPSIDDDDQMFAIETFIEFVKSLKGDAKVVKDAFDNIDFELTGISSEKVKAAYEELIAAERDKDLGDEGPFNYLTSWTIDDSGDQIEEEEMELDTEIPYEGPEHKLDGFGDEFVQDSPVEEVDVMDTDDSVNPFPSLMPDEQGKFDRMMGLIDQNIEPRLGQVKSVIDGAREQGYADRTIFSVLARHPLVKDSIEALVDDGFEFQDIVDFFATDFSQNEEIAGYKAGVQMEGAEEYTVDFGTNTMTYTLDRDNSVLKGLKPGIVPGANREEDIIPVTISPEGYLSTSDRRIKDISPKSNKSPWTDPSYRNID